MFNFKKKMLESDLITLFLSSYQEDMQKAIDFVFEYVDKSSLLKDKELSIPKSEAGEIIALWFFAAQILPVFNLFQDKLQKNIYSRCVDGFSKIREVDVLWTRQNIDEFINDFNTNYDKRVVGRFSAWLMIKLYGEIIKDPILLQGLDLFINEASFKWNKAVDEYKIIPEAPTT